MLAGTVVQTKLRPPPERAHLVPRPGLGNRFATGLVGKLTVVSAPAGFGKTTAVSARLATPDRPCGWPTPRSQEIADALEDSHFFVYPGSGHGVGTSHPCPNAMMLTFIADPSRSPDAGCIAAMGDGFGFPTSLPGE